MSEVLANRNYSPLQEMKLISEGKLHDPFLGELNGKMVNNQAKLFLAAQARNELMRIMRLTEFLDKIEDKFMKAVSKSITEQPDNINLLITSMDIITQSLKRSQELVHSVLDDDSLQTLVVNNINLVPGVTQTAIMSRKSRDAIRTVASSLISQLQQTTLNTDTTEIIELKEETETTNNVENVSTDFIDNKINELLED